MRGGPRVRRRGPWASQSPSRRRPPRRAGSRAPGPFQSGLARRLLAAVGPRPPGTHLLVQTALPRHCGRRAPGVTRDPPACPSLILVLDGSLRLETVVVQGEEKRTGRRNRIVGVGFVAENEFRESEDKGVADGVRASFSKSRLLVL